MSRSIARFFTQTLHGRLLLATAVPPLLMTVLLTANSVWDRHSSIRSLLYGTGNSTATYLASTADFALYSGNKVLLSSLATSTAQIPTIKGVAFLDSEYDIVTASRHFPLQDNLLSFPPSSFPVEIAGHLYFLQPVLISGVQVDDYDALGNHPAEKEPIGWVIVALDLSSSVAERRQVLVSSIAIAAVVMLTAFILTYVLSRSVIAPIRKLTQTVSLMEQGDLTARAEATTRDELASLAHGINHLARSVGRSQQELEHRIYQATIRLQDAMKDLQTKNLALENATREAETANHAKSDFLARMSHELRTPLTSIQGFVRLLEKSSLVPSEKYYCSIIDQAATQLLHLIDDILEFARIQEASVKMENGPFNLVDCVENPLQLLAPTAHDKGVELILDIASDVPAQLVGDAVRIRQVLSNLVANAIKFTADGFVHAAISVDTWSAQAATVKIQVKDTGIGIPQEKQQQIFEAFIQADTSISRRFGGTGLGLAIVKTYVELMGGTIAVDSTEELGTKITVLLPLTRQQPGEPPWLHPWNIAVFDPDHLSRLALQHALQRFVSRVVVFGALNELEKHLSANPCQAVVVGNNVVASTEASLDTMTTIRGFTRTPMVVISSLEKLHQIIGREAAVSSLQPVTFLSKPAGVNELRSALIQMVSNGGVSDPAPILDTYQPLIGVEVLVAEDNNFSRLLLKTLLERVGCDCTMVADGEAAIRATSNRKFDALLIDVHMPGMDGIEAVQRIRKADNPNSRTPIIALTADILQHEEERMRRAGANELLLKPIDENHLIQTLISRIGKPARPLPDLRGVGQAIPKALFVAEIDSLVTGARTAFQQQQPDELREIVHQLLGIAGIFKLPALEAAVRDLHRHIASHNRRHIQPALVAVENLARELQRELDDFPEDPANQPG